MVRGYPKKQHFWGLAICAYSALATATAHEILTEMIRGKDPTSLEAELFAETKTNIIGNTHLFNLFVPLLRKGNTNAKKVIFIKDSWRPLVPGMEKETDILRTLNQKEVRNVPKLICGDDLQGQSTLTKDFVSEPWNLGALEEDLSKRSHMRFGEDFIGQHLRTFESSKQFLQAVFDAFIGMWPADY